MGFAMTTRTIGWSLMLNVAAVASLSLRPFKIYDWTYGKDIPPDISPRIYNGLEAREGQFTFMIAVLVAVGDKVTLCSSALVAPSWVLTAAHCLNWPDRGRVILVGGRANIRDYVSERINTDFEYPLNEKTYGVQERWAKQIHIHPDYDDTTYEHDVALIRVNKPFILQGTISTIPLSTEYMTSRKFCTILGWGMVLLNAMPYTLNYVERKEVSTTKLGCITKKEGSFICLTPDFRGICRGDSGSPLVCDGKIWGVASHMQEPEDVGDVCGYQTEDFYTDTYYSSKWLLKYINGGHVSCNVNLKSLLSCLIVSIYISLKI